MYVVCISMNGYLKLVSIYLLTDVSPVGYLDFFFLVSSEMVLQSIFDIVFRAAHCTLMGGVLVLS